MFISTTINVSIYIYIDFKQWFPLLLIHIHDLKSTRFFKVTLRLCHMVWPTTPKREFVHPKKINCTNILFMCVCVYIYIYICTYLCTILKTCLGFLFGPSYWLILEASNGSMWWPQPGLMSRCAANFPRVWRRFGRWIAYSQECWEMLRVECWILSR